MKGDYNQKGFDYLGLQRRIYIGEELDNNSDDTILDYINQSLIDW